MNASRSQDHAPTAILLPSLNIGGSQKKLINIANELKARQVDIHIIYLNHPDKLQSQIRKDIPAYCLQRKGKFSLPATNRLAKYLDENGAIVADTAGNFGSIRFVRGSITGFQHTLLIPFVSDLLTINAPDFATTVPRESLGVLREGASATCFGS